ncbi:hypothetical protein D3C85_951430 [compost metagenome]
MQGDSSGDLSHLFECQMHPPVGRLEVDRGDASSLGGQDQRRDVVSVGPTGEQTHAIGHGDAARLGLPAPLCDQGAHRVLALLQGAEVDPRVGHEVEHVCLAWPLGVWHDNAVAHVPCLMTADPHVGQAAHLSHVFDARLIDRGGHLDLARSRPSGGRPVERKGCEDRQAVGDGGHGFLSGCHGFIYVWQESTANAA